MGTKLYKPTSPARRFMMVSDFADISDKNKSPERSLLEPLKRSGGRNRQGRITSRYIGGGHKRQYRRIDFKRSKIGVPAKVVAIEYDPNRTARIALLQYADGEKAYILAPLHLVVGDSVISAASADIKPGNSLPLRAIPVGTTIHNIELRPGKGGQIVRSAGAGALLLAREEKYAQLRLPSGELRQVLVECRATVGQVGNLDHENIELGKAGRTIWSGRRPHVRGVAMNPVDHPHGGGEGRTSGGRHPVTPWGVPTRGHKTRHNKRTDRFILKRRNTK